MSSTQIYLSIIFVRKGILHLASARQSSWTLQVVNSPVTWVSGRRHGRKQWSVFPGMDMYLASGTPRTVRLCFLWWIWCVRVAVWSSGAWHARQGNGFTSGICWHHVHGRPESLFSHYGCVVCSMSLFPYIHDRCWIRTDHYELFWCKVVTTPR